MILVPHLNSGNNAIAFKGAQTATTAESGANLDFEFVQDETQAPTVAVNVNAARVNAFYIVNTIHDISFKYGFTAAAFKFVPSIFAADLEEWLPTDRVPLASRITTLDWEGLGMTGY